MEIVHILTVGTSLLENKGGNGRTSAQHSREVNQLNQQCDKAKQLAETQQLKGLLETQKPHVLHALNDLDLIVEGGFRPPKRNGPTDRLPQEVSYLWLHHSKGDGQDEPKADCYLLASDTKEGQFCAAVIQDYVNQHSDLSRHYHVVGWEPVPGVNARNAQAFEEDGFRNLLDKADSIIQSHKSASRIYLNPTGGFKGLMPYSTLQGMLYASGQTLHTRDAEAILCYLFEETPDIIYMRSYPIGLNFHHWHSNATRLRMVRRGEMAFKDKLSKEMQNLLYNDAGTEKLFSLGRYLEGEYQRQLSEDPLKVYSREIIHGLLPDSLGGEVQKLRGILDELVQRVGDLIWVGDKIPEMVDHALKHHQHLLEFAELFLTPILAKDPGFMNSKERFCLLAGILLHDCGHSLDYLKSETMETPPHGEILLFPSDVRDYHHFLTADRLDSHETAKELAWPGQDGFKKRGLDKELHDAARTVCLYHRRRTGYERYNSPEEETKAKNHLTGKPLLPLLKDPTRSRLKAKEVDLMKVVAFMRLIDGCDVQSRRAGSPQFVEQKLMVLDRDYHTALRRAREAFALYRDTVAASKKSEDFKQLTEAIHQEEAHYRLEDPERQARISCFNLLKNTNPEVKRLAHLWLIAAELVDRADMKFKQREHYLKHRCVKEVLVFPSTITIKPEKKLEFDVVLFPDPGLKGTLNGSVKTEKGQQKMKELIEKEISSEYGSVQTYASQHYGLRVRYWWEDRYEAWRTSSTGTPFFP